jgi:hypothetical protein
VHGRPNPFRRVARPNFWNFWGGEFQGEKMTQKQERAMLRRLDAYAQKLAKEWGLEGDYSENEKKRAARDLEVRAQRGNRKPVVFKAPATPGMLVEAFLKTMPGIVSPD